MTTARMRTRSLLNQVLAVNAVLVAVTAVIALLVPATLQGMILIGTAVVAALLLNSLMLKRRLVPLETLLETLGAVAPPCPGKRPPRPPAPRTRSSCAPPASTACSLASRR